MSDIKELLDRDTLKAFFKKKTVQAVMLFIVILGAFLTFEKAEAAEPIGYVALGHSTFNYYQTTGEIAYTPGRWAIAAQLIGEGSYEGSKVETTKIYSVSRFVNAPFNQGRPYARIGVAYVDDQMPLVGTWNFRLGLGYRAGRIRFEIGHYSSAGIWNTNRGIDFIQVGFSL